MKYVAWAVLTLGLLLFSPTQLHAQDKGKGAELGRNYPNPFNPETTIPFTLDRELFANGRKPVVSMRIYNVLAQLVAIPILQGSGEELKNLEIEWNGTGRYSAYWDGKYRHSSREAASGVYLYQLIVNGRKVASKRMTIVK